MQLCHTMLHNTSFQSSSLQYQCCSNGAQLISCNWSLRLVPFPVRVSFIIYSLFYCTIAHTHHHGRTFHGITILTPSHVSGFLPGLICSSERDQGRVPATSNLTTSAIQPPLTPPCAQWGKDLGTSQVLSMRHWHCSGTVSADRWKAKFATHILLSKYPSD